MTADVRLAPWQENSDYPRKKQAKLFSNKVLEIGGIPVEVPLLKITCKAGQDEIRTLQGNEHFSWLFLLVSMASIVFSNYWTTMV